MLGIKTIGNATLVAYEDVPVLATDPWFGAEDDAYFGSWTLSHIIPADIRQDILDAKYIWFSHGHPDHLNPNSVQRLKHSQILLPDHVGDRIKKDLLEQGYNVQTLPDREWVSLSKRIRVFCISDYIQDAVLLVEVGGRLFINMNDSGARARLNVIPKIARGYKDSYLLRLSGYGDADMINFFDEEGNRKTPLQNHEVGKFLGQYAQRVGAKNVIPFSSFHHYQREDSAWGNAYTTPMTAYKEGFDSRLAGYIDPFVWIDCVTGEIKPISPEDAPAILRPSEDFGDNWSDEFEAGDHALLDDYFKRKAGLHDVLGFLTFKVGSKSHTVDLGGPKEKGITFEVPRGSLMAAVDYRVFDDLLIGNYMKTTLHNVESLYNPNFNFIVAKYGDNGGAETKAEVRAYLEQYRKRSGTVDWVMHQFGREGHTLFRRYVQRDSKFYAMARDVYSKALRT